MGLSSRKDEYTKAYEEMLLNYKWQWFCSLNLQSGSDCPMAESKLKAWRINMGIKDHILIAYMGVFNTVPQPHIHLLLCSKRNRFGKTLMNLKPKDWQTGWSDITHCTAVIGPVYDREGVATYIAEKNLPLDKSELIKWDRSELIQPYNKRLLEKAMIR